jgi:Putative peptidoglycan binding domain/Domain of unknown function (DUF4347)
LPHLGGRVTIFDDLFLTNHFQECAMPEFVWLREGDRLPAVAVLQHLLKRTGIAVAPDGAFGPRTKEAVRRFQKDHGLKDDGIVGIQTWPRLKSSEPLPILDFVDIFEPDLGDAEARVINKAGGNALMMGGACNGIEQATQMIGQAGSNLFMLRLHGHGAPGEAGISEGRLDARQRSAFKNLESSRQALQRIRHVFGPYGCIQFMHCSVGSGAAGQSFLQMVADTLMIPASAAYHVQLGGPLKETVRFEGAVRTVCPGGVSLATWARSLPEFAGVSVA